MIYIDEKDLYVSLVQTVEWMEEYVEATKRGNPLYASIMIGQAIVGLKMIVDDLEEALEVSEKGE